MTKVPSPKAFGGRAKTETTRRGLAALAGRARAFRRDESGVMIAYSVFFFLIMLIVAGIGVDLMHFEMKRTRLQHTLDRAVLAAADMQQPLDPTAVVADYLSKAGVDATLNGTPTVNSGLNFRDVTAGATLTVPTQFIHMLGFDSLSAPAMAQAEERIEGVEISLVLDISGSMKSNNRLVNLKPAAREFIETMMDLTQAGDVSVSIIPYNTQVNAGAALLSNYNATTEHSYSNCVNFEPADFFNAGLSPSQQLQRTGHFDVFTTSQGPDQTSTLSIPVCPTWTGAEVTVMSTNETLLKNRIDALTANGNTSIDVGMKWAAALLDPGTRPVISSMIASGDVEAVNAGRPLNYDEPGVLKVIVVMTDGQNTTQYRLPDHMRSGNTNVYYNTAATDSDLTDRYSIWDGGRLKYYWLRDGTYHTKAYGDHISGGTNTAQRLTYPQLSAMNSQRVIADRLYAPVVGSTQARADWYDNIAYGPDRILAPEKNTRLQNICTAAKNNDVMIYAIGFEATADGNTQLSNCASSPSHFFNASGVNIRDVFQTIAISIAQLRLTQ